MTDRGEPMIDKLEECTTWSRRLRHWSMDLHKSVYSPDGPGREGLTLCGAAGIDEAQRNWWLAQYSDTRISVAALPVCTKCERKAAKL